MRRNVLISRKILTSFAAGKKLMHQAFSLRRDADLNINFVFLHRTRYGLLRLFEQMGVKVCFRNPFEYDQPKPGPLGLTLNERRSLWKLKQHWKTIRETVNQALRCNRYCAVATINPDGSPRISPIGSLVLREPGKAVYFEQFPKEMRQNLERDRRVCVLAVSGGFGYWLKALFRGTI